MAENTSRSEALSIQKVRHVRKMSPYAERMKRVRSLAAYQRGVEKLSQVQFAKIVGTHPSTISHIEAGTTRIQPELAMAIEREMGVSQAWLLTGQGPTRVANVPGWDDPAAEPPQGDTPGAVRRSTQFSFSYVKKVKPRLSGGSGELSYDETAEDFYAFRRDWLIQKGNVPAMRLAEVSGDSMEPTLRDGDFVLFDTSKQIALDGKIMVVGIDELLFIKRVRVFPDGTFLVSDNKAVYEPWRINPENTRFLGVVVWHCGDV